MGTFQKLDITPQKTFYTSSEIIFFNMSDIPTRCLKCASLDLVIFIGSQVKPPHWGKLSCNECKAYLQWVGKPNFEQRKQTVKKNVLKDSNKICCFCGQGQTEMKNGNFLSVDHQVQLKDGGEDSEDNAWVLCDGCHKLKNWLVIHRNKYADTKKGELVNERSSEDIARP